MPFGGRLALAQGTNRVLNAGTYGRRLDGNLLVLQRPTLLMQWNDRRFLDKSLLAISFHDHLLHTQRGVITPSSSAS